MNDEVHYFLRDEEAKILNSSLQIFCNIPDQSDQQNTFVRNVTQQLQSLNPIWTERKTYLWFVSNKMKLSDNIGSNSDTEQLSYSQYNVTNIPPKKRINMQRSQSTSPYMSPLLSPINNSNLSSIFRQDSTLPINENDQIKKEEAQNQYIIFNSNKTIFQIGNLFLFFIKLLF